MFKVVLVESAIGYGRELTYKQENSHYKIV